MRFEYPLGVVHVITNLLPGGVASHIFYLLSGLDRSKWNPIVVALVAGDEKSAPFAQNNIPVHVLNVKHISGIAGLFEGVRKIAKITRTIRPAVLHTHFDRAAYYGRIASRLVKIPVSIRTVHGAEEMTCRRLRRERRLRRCTDHYNAVSNYTRRYLAEQGFDLNKTLVI
ncbi:MAG: glycosyltransferase, partial [Armatimonadetes bacterium]|nr:glycosyltransferase [Armatimonadota bacterium]